MKNRLFWICLLLTFFILSSSPGLGMEAFVIDHYQVNVTVAENNTYLVTETLKVEFSQPMHGIFREIPARYTQPATGKSRSILIDNIMVEGHPFQVDKNRSGANIRIGNPDSLVEGIQQYRISYTMDIGRDNISEYDELYLNLIGRQWDTQIRKADFEILFPKPFDTTKYNLTGGVKGSTDNTFFVHNAEGRMIKASTTRVLQPFEAVTIRVELPEGYFVGARDIKDPFYGRFYLFLLFALVLSIFLWFRFGRDDLVVTPVEFTPPEGMSPAETGYIIDGHTDTKDITSLLIYWAEKGHISIEELDEKNFRFHKLKPLPPDAKDFEKYFFEDLFKNREQVDTADLKYKFAESMSSAKKDVTHFFRKNPEQRIFTTASLWARGAISLLILLIAGLTAWKLAFEASGDRGPGLIAAIFGGLAVMIATLIIQVILDKWHTIGPFKRIFSLAAVILALLILTIIALSVAGNIPKLQLMILAVLITTGILAVFSFIARKRTSRGIQLLGRILGLKDFIKRAEMDRIKMLVDENPQYFYSVLPYAYSLGLSEKWAQHFTDVLTPPPTWYQGGSGSGAAFTPVLFTRSLNNAMRNTEANMAAVKSSSGGGRMSGGGGFSGGGAGGGGGGGW